MDVQFPIGRLEVPERVTKEQVIEWMEEIRTYTARLRKAVDGLTEEQLNKTYREGSWNVRQLVHHIADSQLVMFQRLKLALTADNPLVPAFDQDAWAELTDSSLTVESSIRMLEGMNERIIALGNSVDADKLNRKFTHENNGEITVATKLKKLSWHEEHHLAHIHIALES